MRPSNMMFNFETIPMVSGRHPGGNYHRKQLQQYECQLGLVAHQRRNFSKLILVQLVNKIIDRIGLGSGQPEVKKN